MHSLGLIQCRLGATVLSTHTAPLEGSFTGSRRRVLDSYHEGSLVILRDSVTARRLNRLQRQGFYELKQS